MQEAHANQDAPFVLNLIRPFSTFVEGKPKSIPYTIDGLLPEGSFSILAGKAKHGKSSLSRYEAVCVSKGVRCLGRDTVRGESLLISLEDPLYHVDNCLMSLGWNPQNDEPIHIVTKLHPSIDKSIAAIEAVIVANPNIRFVVVDTLAKLLRVGDMNDYSKVMPQVEKVHILARRYPHIHLQGLAHCKKLRTDDVFDSLLGSMALRGEPDTTIALYTDSGQRLIASETRIGRNFPPTILEASIVDTAGAHVVGNFALGVPFSEHKTALDSKSEKKRKLSHEQRVIEFLQKCPDYTATQVLTLGETEGKNSSKIAAINRLIELKIIAVSGKKQSPTDPLTLQLHPESLRDYDFITRFDTPGGDADAHN